MNGKKRFFIIHGWKSGPEDAWFPWLKTELEKLGGVVFTPFLPDPDKPKIELWLENVKEIIGEPDTDTFLIGHSLGAFIVLKYLEYVGSLGKKIGGAILVAGGVHREGRPHVDPELVWRGTLKMTALFSDNDYYIPLTEKDFFKENLGARVLALHNRGHFSRKEGVLQLPELLSEIKRMVYPKNRAVGALIRGLPGEEELLVFLRNYYGEKFFCLPGGSIEEGETKEGALGRELREELGIEIKNQEFIFEIDHEARKEFYFLVREWQGELQNTGMDGNAENTSTFVWKKFKDLPRLSPVYPTEGFIKILAHFKLTP